VTPTTRGRKLVEANSRNRALELTSWIMRLIPFKAGADRTRIADAATAWMAREFRLGEAYERRRARKERR
jgi:hypothetical protein